MKRVNCTITELTGGVRCCSACIAVTATTWWVALDGERTCDVCAVTIPHNTRFTYSYDWWMIVLTLEKDEN